MRKIADVVPPKLRAAARRDMQEMIKKLGRTTFPVELWIDENDLLRRERYFFSAPEDKLEMTMTAEFFDYGTPVDVEPPPADDVYDATAQLEGELDTP
jgi:hypothetical protein